MASNGQDSGKRVPQQVTMKPLEGWIKEIRAGTGYALLGSGDVAIALDCERLGQEFVR